MSKTIVGVFDDMDAAQNAVNELSAAGIPPGHVRLMDNADADDDEGDDGDNTRGDGGASWNDKVSNWFKSLFDDDDDRSQADHYAEAWRRGNYLVVADVETEMADTAVTIMNRHGSVDLNRRTEQWKQTGYTGKYDQTAARYTDEEREREFAGYAEGQGQTIPVVQEELAIGKQVVQRGGVRIHSYVKELPVEEVVRLREEQVNVQRRPVNRAVSEAEGAFREKTIELTATGEEAVVGKRARVVEEVSIGKNVREREQTITDKVRRQEVEVEQIAADVSTTTTPSGSRR